MKKFSITSLLLLFSFFTLTIACNSTSEQKVEKKNNQTKENRTVSPAVIFENEFAKVIKVTLEPGDKLEAHEGQKRLVYSLSDYSIEWTESGENKGIKNWKKGDIHIHEADNAHSAINTGSTKAEWLVFVPKTDQLPEIGKNSIDKDVNSVAQETAKILFDDQAFRVTEVKLPAAGKIPTHSGINRIIYSLSDYSIQYTSDKHKTGPHTFKAGDLHWHEADEHAVENIGQNEANFIIISFK